MKLNNSIEITNEHNKLLMSRYPDNYFDIAIVDPPYFSGPEKRKYYGNSTGNSFHSKTGVKQKIKRVEYSTSDWSEQIPDVKFLNELIRVSKHQIIFGINYFEFGDYHPGRIVWDKVNNEYSFSDCEIALCTKHESVRLVRYMWNGMMQGESIHNPTKQIGDKRNNEKRIHPTQKPVKLYEYLLDRYTNEGDKVLDTHLGSGSIAIACHNLNRQLVASELDDEYFKSAVRRIELHISQSRLKL